MLTRFADNIKGVAFMTVLPENTERNRSLFESHIFSGNQQKYLWFGIGTILSIFAVGGRFDVALAAWLMPVFLLRFSRLSKPLIGLALIWMLSCADTAWWLIQTSAENSSFDIRHYLISLSYGTGMFLPYLLDRLLASRLGSLTRIMVFPLAIVLAEYLLVSLNPYGASYGIRVITQNGNLPLLQLIAITGPYGVGFLIGWFATTVNAIWEAPKSESSFRIGGIFTAALVAVLLFGGLRLALAPPGGDYVKIAGLTPSKEIIAEASRSVEGFPRSREAVAAADADALQSAYNMINAELIANTRKAADAGAQIVLWSENGAPSLAPYKGDLLAEAAEVAIEKNIYLLVASSQPYELNETHMIDPEGEIVWSYQKNHPVPYAEPVPPGSSAVPVVDTPFGRIASIICFDGDFPYLSRVNADIMLIPGYDRPNIGRVHTLKMTSARAVENGFAMFRQDFDGYSAAFDHQGRILAGQDTTGQGAFMMMADVPIRGSRTFYNIAGDVFAWLCILALFGLTWMAVKRH